MGAPQQVVELNQLVGRCAAALSEVPRLKQELQTLKESGDESAAFAIALFELELARRGDSETRSSITHLAQKLLGFWRDGSGERASHGHATLRALWLSVTPMLMQFEARRFDLALVACWKHRQEPAELQRVISNLQPEGEQRVEFARCLYHLELARQGVDSSRTEFAQRAGLLAEAYRDKTFADELVGKDAGLQHLWEEVKPYLDEFFEHLEEQARKTHSTATVVADADISIDEELPPPPPAPSVPPPPPNNMTPPGGWVMSVGDIDIVEAEAPPPAPPQTPVHGLAAVPFTADDVLVVEEGDFEPDDATISFWDYTFAALQHPPVDGQKPRMLASETREERKALSSWLEGLKPHLHVPEARAFGALVRLMLAGKTKDKSLFGQPNPRRKEALQAAFALLSPTPEAAGRAAVWFEFDGPETRIALEEGLELLMPFLAYCARNQHNPLQPETVAAYFKDVNSV